MSDPLEKFPELVILVDNNDKCIGFEEKVAAHRGDGKQHRAISVFLFNKDGELLIQRRSTKKIVGALQWANTCCGNVRKGETRKHCAYRRLYQELGISEVGIRKIDRLHYHTRCNDLFSEWEIDDIYVGRYDGPVNPNPEEVCEFSWIEPSTFLSRLETDREQYFAPWVAQIVEHTFIKSWLQNPRNPTF